MKLNQISLGSINFSNAWPICYFLETLNSKIFYRKGTPLEINS